MAARRTRILSRKVSEAVETRKREREEKPVSVSVPYVPKEKTERDKLFDIIDKWSCRGYRFTDSYYGMSLIAPEDIEERGNGIFVIRFRCDPVKIHEVFFYGMARDVCNEVRSGMHFIHETRCETYGLESRFKMDYEECVWVIQKGELDLTEEEEEEDETEDDGGIAIEDMEEFPDDFRDDSTAEEVDERFTEAEENFI